MKKLYFFWFISLICLLNHYTYSQNIGDLKGIYYQAVAIDENGKEIVGMDINGKPLYEKAIGVRFTITKGLNGAVQWEETHTVTTDKYGLFSLTIGLGNLTGNGLYNRLLDIPWIDADQFLKVEIATKNDGNYKLVSNQQFMAVPYSFYTDDIADDAITTAKILDSTIINQDIHLGAIDSRTIQDEAVFAEDIDTNAITTSEILDSTIINRDIETDAIDSRSILDETVLAEDIETGAVTSTEILNGTILNEDIADGTINLKSKVIDTLSVLNGGTGRGVFDVDRVLIGNGTSPISAKIISSPDNTVLITQTADSLNLRAVSAPTQITSDPAGTFVIGNLPAGSTYTSNAINAFAVGFGDIIIGSIDADLQGCMLTAYVSQPNVIRVSIFNGTGTAQNLGTVNVKVFIVR